MVWFSELIMGHSVAHVLLVLSIVVALGVAAGRVKIGGVSMGIAGVLFSGIFIGHLYGSKGIAPVSAELLEFIRDFGLVLFVYTIGVQIGPAFFASFKRNGLLLNSLTVVVVLLGVGIAAVICHLSGLHVATVAGVMSGAVTNTPGLGAAQQAVSEAFPSDPKLAQLPALGYAMTYPFGIFGIIIVMLLAKLLFRVDVVKEAAEFNRLTTGTGHKLDEVDSLPEEEPPDKQEHTDVMPIFIGVALGVILGSIPVHIPGVPAPLKLGIAGGPLLVAIVFGRVRRLGPLNWELPIAAHLALREVGITLFLACVGLRSGAQFLETLKGDGLLWMAMGALITLVPLIIVMLAARIIFRMNYLPLCGLLAGSCTDPPALSFATQMSKSDAPSLTYATVYALAMFLRILAAQALVIAFAG